MCSLNAARIDMHERKRAREMDLQMVNMSASASGRVCSAPNDSLTFLCCGHSSPCAHLKEPGRAGGQKNRNKRAEK